MSNWIEIYNLKQDKRHINNVQKVSLDKNGAYGYRIENELLFGSPAWFNAIERGIIKEHKIKGVISKVYMSGHNDFPSFKVENAEGKTTWERKGNEEDYKVGLQIEIVLVNQRNRQGVSLQCVTQVMVAI